MPPRHLINEDGDIFSDDELDELTAELDSLSIVDRTAFRNANADAIAKHLAKRMLIVAGPGTGKSSIFKQRILAWLERNPNAQILGLSFVRKLVADLSSDIQNDTRLTDAQKRRCDIFTLHKYARRIVEQNHGTNEWRLAPHFRIIGQSWTEVVWHDVLLLSGQNNFEQYSWRAFEKQLHDDEFPGSVPWRHLKKTYFTLCKFYNAAGFGDLILRAKDALVENPNLNQHHFFIVDEYQDFNVAEERLLEQTTQAAEATLIVGDDDQVLYEKLKSGKASLIRAIYGDPDVVNAMLAFCGRCDFHITRTASHFIKQAADPESIKKIYLPMAEAGETPKVQIIACATPTTAVDYVRKFINEHEAAIEQRRQDLQVGKSKDAYLLILSPTGAVNFYRANGAKDRLFELIAPYTEERPEFSEDYYKVLNYYSLARYPQNNFTFRKVLYHEDAIDDELLPLLKIGTVEGKSFSAIDADLVRTTLAEAEAVRGIMESEIAIEEKVERLRQHITMSDPTRLKEELERDAIDTEQAEAIERQDEETAEMEEIEVRQMCAVEFMTIVGSKGLSADHAIVIGFDNINMAWVSRNAFFVAMTRARKSLHLLTALKAGGATQAHDFLDALPDGNIEFFSYTKGKGLTVRLTGRRGFTIYLRRLADQGWQRR
jgi:superfamily I DNA/RNA helicase